MLDQKPVRDGETNEADGELYEDSEDDEAFSAMLNDDGLPLEGSTSDISDWEKVPFRFL